MAQLPDQTFIIVFTLQQRLLENIDQATATDATILEQFGETAITAPELEQL